MKIKKYTFFALILSVTFNLIFFFSKNIYPATLRLAQIDSSAILWNQNIDLYLSLTDAKGKPLSNLTDENFEVLESTDQKVYQKIENIRMFSKHTNFEKGIHFLLLIDNSNSMYRSLLPYSAGPDKPKSSKIHNAKQVIKQFLYQMQNPLDRVSLVAYNTHYALLNDFSSEKMKIIESIDTIQKPNEDDGFTEIFASLHKAVASLKQIKGRKVIIILSDGENRSFTAITKKDHPEFGRKIYSYRDALLSAQKEGVSIFTVNYGTNKLRYDRQLNYISHQSGGAVFDASNDRELKKVYERIADQVVNEYFIRYKATMLPANKRFVKVVYKPTKKPYAQASSERFYFSATVFGLPMSYFNPFLLIPLLLALALAYFLSKIKFEKKIREPRLELIDAGNAKNITQVYNLGKNRTLIGSDKKSDVTIQGGLSNLKSTHATIFYNQTNDSYTIISNDEIKINNANLRRKNLEAGDVINLEGTSMVFDDGK